MNGLPGSRVNRSAAQSLKAAEAHSGNVKLKSEAQSRARMRSAAHARNGGNDKMALAYTIERKEQFGEIRLEAKPNEWATTAHATVVVEPSPISSNNEVPRIEHIGWSAGARNWTLEDARTFFRAALEMLDMAEAEFKRARP